MSNKKIVIISNYTFPMENPRASRATELAKQFASLGHFVTLYASLGSYDYTHYEKKNNFKVKNIGKLQFAILNSDGVPSKSLWKRLLIKLFKKVIEFPSIEIMFKMPKIIRGEKNVDLLVTIANPHSIHWGGALCKSLYPSRFPKTWLADCGDPYMGNKFENHYFYFKYLEKHFCKKADNIIIPIQGAIEGYYKEFHEKIKIIPQGFNFDSINLNTTQKKDNKILTFAYAGTFYKGIRDPTQFLNYLQGVSKEYKFIVFTKNSSLLEPHQDKLGSKLEISNYIPRVKLLQTLSTMDFLVNFENGTEVQSPSKLIDYALTKRPILSINSKVFEKEKIKAFLDGNYEDSLVIEDIDQYDIKNVADAFLDLIK